MFRRTLVSYDPQSGEVVGEVPTAGESEISEVIRNSREALVAWRQMPLEDRASRVRSSVEKLRASVEDLALLISKEMGKSLAESRAEIMAIAAQIDAKLPEICAALRRTVIEDDNNITSTIYREPLGVCAVIAPWNFPLYEPLDLVVPALVAGNTVVLKPSEMTPLVGAAAAAILNETLPEYVLQVVHGGEEQGKMLVESDGVDLVAFTGSRAAGKDILQAAAGNMKRVILELGGKNPMIVLDDADIDAAARFVVHDAFRGSGQVCVGTERVYVDEKIADAFIGRVIELTEELHVVSGIDDANPSSMITAQAKEAVISRIKLAQEAGARVLVDGSARSPGNDAFLQPSVLVDVDNSMDIMREETFGPVLCIARFQSLPEAIRLANDSPYGLGAVVFGQESERASEIARALDVGMIGINKSCHGAQGSPWVGIKQSGYGWHSGVEGHRQFTVPRVVSQRKDC